MRLSPKVVQVESGKSITDEDLASTPIGRRHDHLRKGGRIGGVNRRFLRHGRRRRRLPRRGNGGRAVIGRCGKLCLRLSGRLSGRLSTDIARCRLRVFRRRTVAAGQRQARQETSAAQSTPYRFQHTRILLPGSPWRSAACGWNSRKSEPDGHSLDYSKRPRLETMPRAPKRRSQRRNGDRLSR